MANKLELTWYGKDEPIRVEPRLLIENTELSNTAADPETQNMLIHGDNLLALKALESKLNIIFSSAFRSVVKDDTSLLLKLKSILFSSAISV